MAVSKIERIPRLKTTRKAFVLGVTNPGDNGMVSVQMDSNDISSENQIVSMSVMVGSVTQITGMQLTPTYYAPTNNTMYLNFYSPRATQQVDATAIIWYI